MKHSSFILGEKRIIFMAPPTNPSANPSTEPNAAALDAKKAEVKSIKDQLTSAGSTEAEKILTDKIAQIKQGVYADENALNKDVENAYVNAAEALFASETTGSSPDADKALGEVNTLFAGKVQFELSDDKKSIKLAAAPASGTEVAGTRLLFEDYLDDYEDLSEQLNNTTDEKKRMRIIISMVGLAFSALMQKGKLFQPAPVAPGSETPEQRGQREQKENDESVKRRGDLQTDMALLPSGKQNVEGLLEHNNDLLKTDHYPPLTPTLSAENRLKAKEDNIKTEEENVSDIQSELSVLKTITNRDLSTVSRITAKKTELKNAKNDLKTAKEERDKVKEEIDELKADIKELETMKKEIEKQSEVGEEIKKLGNILISMNDSKSRRLGATLKSATFKIDAKGTWTLTHTPPVRKVLGSVTGEEDGKNLGIKPDGTITDIGLMKRSVNEFLEGLTENAEGLKGQVEGEEDTGFEQGGGTGAKAKILEALDKPRKWVSGDGFDYIVMRGGVYKQSHVGSGVQRYSFNNSRNWVNAEGTKSVYYDEGESIFKDVPKNKDLYEFKKDTHTWELKYDLTDKIESYTESGLTGAKIDKVKNAMHDALSKKGDWIAYDGGTSEFVTWTGNDLVYQHGDGSKCFKYNFETSKFDEQPNKFFNVSTGDIEDKPVGHAGKTFTKETGVWA